MQRENQRDNDDIDRYVLAANPGKSHGRPNEKPGLEADRANRPTRLRSPNKALSRITRPYGRTQDGDFALHFHAANIDSVFEDDAAVC
jgi:hypothetical protein